MMKKMENEQKNNRLQTRRIEKTIRVVVLLGVFLVMLSTIVESSYIPLPLTPNGVRRVTFNELNSCAGMASSTQLVGSVFSNQSDIWLAYENDTGLGNVMRYRRCSPDFKTQRQNYSIETQASSPAVESAILKYDDRLYLAHQGTGFGSSLSVFYSDNGTIITNNGFSSNGRIIVRKPGTDTASHIAGTLLSIGSYMLINLTSNTPMEINSTGPCSNPTIGVAASMTRVSALFYNDSNLYFCNTNYLCFKANPPSTWACNLGPGNYVNISLNYSSNLSLPTCSNQDYCNYQTMDNGNLFITEQAIGGLSTARIRIYYRGFYEEGQSFPTNVYETTNAVFSINVTYDNSYYDFITAEFVYDGVSTIVSGTTSGNNATFAITKNIPLINQSLVSEIKNFYWNITVTKGTTATKISSLGHQINVTRLNLQDCSLGGFPILNFTSGTEDNLTEVNPFLFEGTFTYSAALGGTEKILNIPRNVVSSKALCLDPSAPLPIRIDGQVKYDGPTPGQFVERDYWFDHDVFGNLTTTNITLYNILASQSTSFIIVVQDQNIIPIPGSFVYIERYYPGLDEYKIVQVAKMDDNGHSVGFYTTETVDYRHTIKLNGTTLLVTEKQKIVGAETPFTLTFTVGEIVTEPLQTFEELPNFDGTMVYDDNTTSVRFTYQDTSGTLNFVNLIVWKQRYNTVNELMCNQTSTTTSGVLTCDLTGEDGTFIAQGYVSRSPGVLAKAIQFIITSATGIFGQTGLFLGWFLILVAAMTGIWNPTVGIIFVNAMVIFVNIIGIATFAPIYIFSLIGISIIAIIFLDT